MAMKRFVGLGVLTLSAAAISFVACDDSSDSTKTTPTGTATGTATSTATYTATNTVTGTATSTVTHTSTSTATNTNPGTNTTPGTNTGTSTPTSTVTGTGTKTGSGTGDCTNTTDLIALKSTDATANWIGGDPASTTDDPCGVQGAIYSYSDEVPSATSPSPISGSPCATGKCCISGTTSAWTKMEADGTTPSYFEWGAGLGLSLRDSGGDTSVKSAYTGTAKGFVITTSGTLSGQEVRVQVTQSASDKSAPFKSFTAGTGIGALSVKFSEVTCPTWATACTVGTTPYDVQVQVVGGDTAGAFNICIDSIVPIL